MKITIAIVALITAAFFAIRTTYRAGRNRGWEDGYEDAFYYYKKPEETP